jgi:hypothetical protein
VNQAFLRKPGAVRPPRRLNEPSEDGFSPPIRPSPRPIRPYASRKRIGRPMALRQASAERGGSRGATAGTDRARCGPIVEVPRSLLSTLKAGFFSLARARLETALFRAIRTVAWDPVRGFGCRSRATHLSVPERSPGRKWTCTSSPQSVGGREAGGSRKRIVLGWPSRGFLGQPVPNSHR